MPNTPHERPPTRPGVVVAIASAATFVAFFDATVVNLAIADLARAFDHASMSALSWVIAAYAVAFAATLTPAGRLADMVGRKAVFIAGFAGFTVTSAASALAPTLGLLIAARALQGLSGALMIPAALGIVLLAVPPERRSAAIGVWGAATSAAAAAGPALGGLLIHAGNWRLVFAVNVPIGVVVIVAAVRWLPALVGGTRTLPDLFGSAMLALAFLLVLLALTQAEPWGWTDARTLAAMLGGLLVLAYGLMRARNHRAPAIEVGLWRSRAFARANAASLVFGFSLFAWLLACALFVTSIWHYSILDAGLAVSPGAVSSAFMALAAGRLLERFGPWTVSAAAGLLLAGCGAWGCFGVGATPAFVSYWLPLGLVSGVGFGALSVALTTAAARALPPAAFAGGTGLNMTARQLGGAVGVAVLASILAGASGIDGYREIFAGCGIADLAVAAISIAGRRQATVAAATAPAGTPAVGEVA